MTLNNAEQAFETSERRLLEHYELEYRSNFYQLCNPNVLTRVIEIGSGPPLLFVHGGGSIAAQWAPLVAQMSGYRMLLVDRPGHGLSGPFDYTNVDLRRHATDFLDGLIDALGLESLPVVGSSMGGAWALRLTDTCPDRVSALALIGCPALLLETGAPLPMRLLGTAGIGKLMWSMRKPNVNMLKDLHTMMGHKRDALDRLPNELWETFVSGGLQPQFSRALLSLLHCAIGPFGPRRNQNITEDELRRVQAPTLLVWGKDDAFGAPQVGERAVGLMPNANLEVIEGGHQPWFEEPHLVAKLVTAFLRERGQ